jgi:hypothetical protein
MNYLLGWFKRYIYSVWTLSCYLNKGVGISSPSISSNNINIFYITLMRDIYFLHNINVDGNTVGY